MGPGSPERIPCNGPQGKTLPFSLPSARRFLPPCRSALRPALLSGQARQPARP